MGTTKTKLSICTNLNCPLRGGCKRGNMGAGKFVRKFYEPDANGNCAGYVDYKRPVK